MFGYYESMQDAFLAHKNLKQEWRDWRNGKLKKSKRAKGNVEPESVTKTRNDFNQKLDFLYRTCLQFNNKSFLLG